MTKLLVVTSIVTLLLAPTTASAKCARVLLAPQALTHPGDPIPSGGGILVGYSSTTDDSADRYADHDPAVNPDWVLLVGKRKVRPKLEILAPGLAVYRPSPVRSARPLTLALREPGGTKIGAWKLLGRPAAVVLPSPTVTTITSKTTQSTMGRGPRTITTVTLELGAAAPAAAVAIIAYRLGGPEPVAIAWSRVTGGVADAIPLYDSPGRCGTEPDGLAAPAPGEKIAVAWVDAFGHRSAPSAAIVVK